MAWAPGALGRVAVDLLLETGGGPDGPGATIDQLVAQAMRRPPAGLRYAAIREYAGYTRHRNTGASRVPLDQVVLDDGAQGITILNGPEGKPWFTDRQAIRRFLIKYLNGRLPQADWLMRDGDRWRLVSADKGPRIPGEGIYDAAARARLRNIEFAHSAYVEAKAILTRINGDAALAELMLQGVMPETHREQYDKRRVDYKTMLHAYAKLDPDQQREIRVALAERSIAANTSNG